MSSIKLSLLIAGGRDFSNYQLCVNALNALGEKGYLPESTEEIEIVSGMARGADAIGVQVAKNAGIQVKEFPADWSTGRNAGYKRNIQMRNYIASKVHTVSSTNKISGALALFFWNGKSRGTAHMICHTRERASIKYIVLDYQGNTLETNIRELKV